MTKGGKIALWVVGGLVAVLTVAIVGIDVWASKLVQKELKNALGQVEELDASVGSIYVRLLSGSVTVHDIHFATKAFAHKCDTDVVELKPGMRADIPSLSVNLVNYFALMRKKAVEIHSIQIKNPRVTVYMDEKHPEAIMPEFPKDTTTAPKEIWLQRFALNHFQLDKACLELKSIRTPLHVVADSLTAHAYDLAYSFADTAFTYNDSIYEVSLAHLALTQPDGLGAVDLRDFSTKNQGAIKLGATRYHNIVTSIQLADKAQEPVTWIDLQLSSVTTSALNPIRKALAQDYTLDSVQAHVSNMIVERDTRYEPKHPFAIPQDIFRDIPARFFIKTVSAKVDKIHIEVRTTLVNNGMLDLKDIRARLDNVTNKPGSVMYCKAHAPIGDEGVVDATFNMYMDKDATFECSLNGKNFNTSIMDHFLRPIVGMTLDCPVNSLVTSYKGDREIAKGVFCMQYDGLNLSVYKQDDIPYKIITNHAKTIQALANSLIPKSNPTAVDAHPRAYAVEWKNDVWKPYPLYVFGPVINGVVETMLPGLYVHKQVKQPNK